MTKTARVWTCDGCGKRETWRKGWLWIEGVTSPANSHQPMSGCCEACLSDALDRAMATTDVADKVTRT